MDHLKRILYGTYAIALFLAAGLAALVLVLVTPGLARRRAIARAGSRMFLRLAGMRLEVNGLEGLPAEPCVVVANHASYLDGVVFTAALPPRFGFVIKREMADVPLVAAMLRRIGAEFVERYNRSKGAADARRLFRNAARGQSLVFFPEGTFSPQPGLLKFHAGAFITAARAGCPVVPAVVRGTRAALPPGSILPRPATITIELLPALSSKSGDTEEAAHELRERARSAILTRLAEPDLAAA
ncbi:MAG TPA: lysophospholipid acyltransferase family protein [Steroidobacteraceae bacterium]